MTTKHKEGRTNPIYKLDSGAYADKVRKAGELADKALRNYGEPTMSLAELRTMIAKRLHGVSLVELVIKERKAGW